MGIRGENSLAELRRFNELVCRYVDMGKCSQIWNQNLRNTNGKIRIVNSVDSSNNMFKHSQF